jgi:hypothetical protein
VISFDLKTARRQFFDSQEVLQRVDPAARKVLSRFGSFTRNTARQSIRYRKKGVSTPGSPPFAHTRDRVRTLKNILFFYDPQRESVVIGPVKLNGSRNLVPRLIESGGSGEVVVKRRQVHARFRPRPFMRPAFEHELNSSLPELWRDAI